MGKKMARIIMIARATGKIAAVTARLPAAGNKNPGGLGRG
jgi:hypothetical protein